MRTPRERVIAEIIDILDETSLTDRECEDIARRIESKVEVIFTEVSTRAFMETLKDLVREGTAFVPGLEVD